MLKYFKGRWPDEIVPEGEPVWSHYEIDIEQDHVLRSVDIFADGRVERTSVELQAMHGDVWPTLWHCSAIETIEMGVLAPISEGEFEALWQQGSDTPRVD